MIQSEVHSEDFSSPIKTQNRWLVVLAAMLLNLVLGSLYSWASFATVLKIEHDWSSFQTQLVLSIATLFLAVGVSIAGFLSEKIGSRRVIVLSAILTGGGYVFSGLFPLHPIIVTIGIGFFAGIGVGISYSLPIGFAVKWFPDKKGIITGISMAGFGLGSVIWQQFFDNWLNGFLGIKGTFVTYGIIFCILIILTSFFLYNPPQGYTQYILAKSGSHQKEHKIQIKLTDTGENNYSTKEMMKQPIFYVLFLTFMLGSAMGLTIIGISKFYPRRILINDSGYSISDAEFIAQIAASIIFPLSNGTGRVIWGWLTDRIGWKLAIIINYSLQAVIMVFLVELIQSPASLYITWALLAMAYGGNFSIFPLSTGQIWGNENISKNYGLLFAAFGVGAIIGPNISGLADDANQLPLTFLLFGILAAISVVLIFLIQKVAHDKVK